MKHHHVLKREADVVHFVQQQGYKRVKRGFRGLESKLEALEFDNTLQTPTDPYYK